MGKISEIEDQKFLDELEKQLAKLKQEDTFTYHMPYPLTYIEQDLTLEVPEDE